MNNHNPEKYDEAAMAEKTARVLESVQANHKSEGSDSPTVKLGQLLRQSAFRTLPESNAGLRDKLLAELQRMEASEVEVAGKKPTMPQKSASRMRLVGGLAAGILVAVSGWWLYQQDGGVELSSGMMIAGHLELSDFPAESSAAGYAVDADVKTVEESMPDDRTLANDTGGKDGKESAGDTFHILGHAEDRAALLAGNGIDKDESRLLAESKALPESIAPTDSQGRHNLGLGVPLAKNSKVNEANKSPSKPPANTGGVLLGSDFYGRQAGQRAESLDLFQAERFQTKGKDRSGQDTELLARGGRGFGGGGFGNGGFGVGGRGGVEEFSESENDELGELWSQTGRFDDHLSGENYTPIHENRFIRTVGVQAVSTFSVDVDTASYANVRRFINAGQRPPADAVRIEELVNYFQYDYPQPKGDEPFSVNMELASCPWKDGHKLLRVGLKGKEVHVNERPATNVVYLIDVSGSMRSDDKLPLLKRGFQMMTRQLSDNDRVSIVTYAGNAGVALEPTTGDQTKLIDQAIEQLKAGGSTHGSAGIEMAYRLAQQNFVADGVNKVILATDGDLNVGVTDDDALVKLIKEKASEGVFLTVLGFGTGNLKDGKLEKLADNGNGHYAYIDSNREAHRVLVQQLSGSLVTIAKDVKIQIEFNPAEVRGYRLIGYENRMLEAQDFANDQKDAGEIGAGHTVTAIYEIVPAHEKAAPFAVPKGMKYQQSGDNQEQPAVVQDNDIRLSKAAASGELATLALRFKRPDEDDSKRIDFVIKNDEKSFTSASDDFRFAASVAGFGMILRGSKHSGVATPEMIVEIASESIGDDKTGYRAEFVDLVRKVMNR